MTMDAQSPPVRISTTSTGVGFAYPVPAGACTTSVPRSHAPVRSISAIASATRSSGVAAESAPMKMRIASSCARVCTKRAPSRPSEPMRTWESAEPLTHGDCGGCAKAGSSSRLAAVSRARSRAYADRPPHHSAAPPRAATAAARGRARRGATETPAVRPAATLPRATGKEARTARGHVTSVGRRAAPATSPPAARAASARRLTPGRGRTTRSRALRTPASPNRE